MAAGRLLIGCPRQRRDLTRLVDIHHNAAILYVARCLNHGAKEESEVALADLCRQVLAIEEIGRWIHDLPWPLFIAGVESRGNRQYQKIISDLYTAIPEVTGFRQYHEVLSFLTTFWSQQ